MDFPEYSIKYAQRALEAKKNLDVTLLPVIDDILDKLAHDPITPRRELIPASVVGTAFIYSNPNPAVEITYEVDTNKKIIYLFHFSAPKLQVRNKLFISYSHKDGEWLEMLKRNLSVLVQQGLIEIWDDQKLRPGEKWEPQIEGELKSCGSALLLISPDFLSSSFITGVELPALLKGAEVGKTSKIFWIHVRRSDVLDDARFKEIVAYQSLLEDPKKPLSDYNDEDKKKALDKIADRIRTAILH